MMKFKGFTTPSFDFFKEISNKKKIKRTDIFKIQLFYIKQAQKWMLAVKSKPISSKLNRYNSQHNNFKDN